MNLAAWVTRFEDHAREARRRQDPGYMSRLERQQAEARAWRNSRVVQNIPMEIQRAGWAGPLDRQRAAQELAELRGQKGGPGA